MKHQITGALLCGAMFFSSCSNMDDDSLVKVQTISIGAVGGAAVGAGLGAAVGALAGGNSKDVAAGAIIGGVVGLLAGAAAGDSWGDSVVKEKQAYRSEMEYIKANIAQLDGRAKQLDDCNAELAAQIKKRGNQISAASAAKTKKNINELITLTNKDIATAQSAGDPTLNQKVAEVTAKRDNLQALAAQLDAVSEKV